MKDTTDTFEWLRTHGKTIESIAKYTGNSPLYMRGGLLGATHREIQNLENEIRRRRLKFAVDRMQTVLQTC